MRRNCALWKPDAGTSRSRKSRKSSGVLVFVLSLVFFYLYVKTVYPIAEVAPAAPTAAATSAHPGPS